MTKLLSVVALFVMACAPEMYVGADADTAVADAGVPPRTDGGATSTPDAAATAPDAAAAPVPDAAPDAAAATAPAWIEHTLSVSGSGQPGQCPALATMSDTFSGLNAVTILFDDFLIENGPGATATSAIRCTLYFAFHYQPGWRFRFKTLDVRGYLGLAIPTYSYTDVAVRMNQQEPATLFTSDRYPPLAAEFTEGYATTNPSERWSSCNGSGVLDVHYWTELLADSSVSEGSIAFRDSLDLIIEWQRCL